MDEILNILSFGDRLKNGVYSLHSKFKTTINFVSSTNLAAISINKNNAAPAVIVVNSAVLPAIKSMKIISSGVYIDDRFYPFVSERIFDSSIKISNFDENIYRKNLILFEKTILEFAHKKSLAFVLDSQKENDFEKGFEAAFINVINSGLRLLKTGRLVEGIKKIKGIGFGLTPSGDDFIAGILYGLDFRSKIEQVKIDEIKELIYSAAEGNSIISNTSFEHAKCGFYFQTLKNLLLSLLDEDKKMIIINSKNLLTLGSTSGSDLAAGFLFSQKISSLFFKLNYNKSVNANYKSTTPKYGILNSTGI